MLLPRRNHLIQLPFAWHPTIPMHNRTLTVASSRHRWHEWVVPTLSSNACLCQMWMSLQLSSCTAKNWDATLHMCFFPSCVYWATLQPTKTRCGYLLKYNTSLGDACSLPIFLLHSSLQPFLFWKTKTWCQQFWHSKHLQIIKKIFAIHPWLQGLTIITLMTGRCGWGRGTSYPFPTLPHPKGDGHSLWPLRPKWLKVNEFLPKIKLLCKKNSCAFCTTWPISTNPCRTQKPDSPLGSNTPQTIVWFQQKGKSIHAGRWIITLQQKCTRDEHSLYFVLNSLLKA